MAGPGTPPALPLPPPPYPKATPGGRRLPPVPPPAPRVRDLPPVPPRRVSRWVPGPDDTQLIPVLPAVPRPVG